MSNGSRRAYHGGTSDSIAIMPRGDNVSGWQESLHVHRGSTIAPRDRVRGGLWSCPGWVCGHLLRLRSLSGSWSVVMSWEVIWSCPVSVVMSWVCVHFLDRGLWSCPGWVCGHLLGLWSFPDSWFVVMSWLGLWSSPKSVIISWLVVCGHVLGLWSSAGSVIISWVVVCGHVLRLWSSSGSVVISRMVVCGHVLRLW